MKSSEKAYDDLTVITGIGPTRQRWLRESFNVRTYQDLATLSVDEIESRLKADGKIPSRRRIEVWLVEARELANTIAKEANSPVGEDEWKSFASFLVVFQARQVQGRTEEQQITILHKETDKSTTMPGIECEQLCQWMLGHLGERLQVEPKPKETAPAKARPAAAPPTEKPSAKIKSSQIRVFQPPQSEAPVQTIEAGKPFHGSVKGDEPFTFEVDFELTGPAAAEIARKQIECNARSYAYDQATKTSIDLGHTGPNTFEEGEFAYTFTLPEATLQRGDYRLWVLVTPQGALAMPDFVEVPLFQVV